MGMLSPHKCVGHTHWGLLLGKGVYGLAGAMQYQQRVFRPSWWGLFGC